MTFPTLDRPHAPDLDVSDPAILQLARLFELELAMESPIEPLYGESLGVALRERIRRTRRERSPSGGLSVPQRERATEFLRAHLERGVSLSELAALTGLSRSQFSRAFRASTGRSAHQWLLHERIRQAKLLLFANRHTIAEIAIATGFTDQAHLTRVFRRLVGTSPGLWRRAQ